MRVPTPLPTGRPVKCPHCARTFALSLDAVIAAPQPAAPVYQVSCPKCAAPLRSSKPVPPGRLSKCPKCANVFRAPGKIETAALRPPTPQKPTVKPAPVKPPADKPTAPTAASPKPANQYTWAKCPKCRSVLRVPGIIASGKPVKCGTCTMVFLIPPKQTRLQPPSQAKTTALAPNGAAPTAPPPKAPVAPRPVLRLDCPGCNTALKLTGALPVGKVLPCPKCKRPLRLHPKKPAAKTKLAANQARKTRLPSGPAKKTKLAAGAARPTKLAGKSAPLAGKTAPLAASPGTHPAKPPAAQVKKPPAASTAQPPAAPAWLRPLKYALQVAVLGAVVALCVVGAGFFGVGPLGGKRDIAVSEFREFLPPGGRCRVALPGTPTPLKASAKGVGGANAHQFVLIRKEDDIAFRLSYWDRPAAERDQVPFKDIARSVESRLRDEVNGIVIQRKDITLDGRPGKEWTIEPEGGGTLSARLYESRGTTEDRFYMLLVGMGRPRQHAASAARIFDSFHIDGK